MKKADLVTALANAEARITSLEVLYRASRVEAGERTASLQVLLERACQDRDRAYQRLSTCAAENASYRHQRDGAVKALGDLLLCVDCLTGEVPDASRMAVVSALQDLHPTADAARALLERYRRPIPAMIERHDG